MNDTCPPRHGGGGGQVYLNCCTMKNIILIISLIITQQVIAQEDSTGVSFKIGVTYNSSLNYYGRTDEAKSSGILPSAELWMSDNFYLSATPVFVNNSTERFSYAGTVATAGFQSLSEKWFTHIYAMKPFYGEEARLVQSALKFQGGMLFSRLNKVLNFSFGGDLKYSDRIDYGALVGLDHSIRIDGKEGVIFIINPGITAQAGTQNFSASYIKDNTGLPLGGSTTETRHFQKFKLLAYEALVPLDLVKGNLMLNLTPAYILPQNLLVDEANPQNSEKGAPMFYLNAGVKYSF